MARLLALLVSRLVVAVMSLFRRDKHDGDEIDAPKAADHP
jgi:hypothetical protein